jgi:hypothetical protein
MEAIMTVDACPVARLGAEAQVVTDAMLVSELVV